MANKQLHHDSLFPCPFCGGMAEYERFANPKNFFTVRCTSCRCCTDGYRLSRVWATDAENKMANAAAWNRRVPWPLLGSSRAVAELEKPEKTF